MNEKNLKKYLKSKRSIFDTFSAEILYLYKEGATETAILKFLIDNRVIAKQSNFFSMVKSPEYRKIKHKRLKQIFLKKSKQRINK